MMNSESMNQLGQIIAQAVQSAVQAQAATQMPVAMTATDGSGSEGPKKEWKVLEEHNFRRMEKFAGGEEAWREWEFDFRTLAGRLPSLGCVC
jgi:hypothetical protein